MRCDITGSERDNLVSGAIVYEKVNQSFIRGIFSKGSKEEVPSFGRKIPYWIECNETDQVIPFILHILHITSFFLPGHDSHKNSHPDQEQDKQQNSDP